MLGSKRGWIRHSSYQAHLGSHDAFLDKFEPLVDAYEPLGERLVFVNDGAKWIWKWVDEHYPKATQILDFYHAVERLCEYAVIYFADKKRRGEWIAQQKTKLLDDQIDSVIASIEAMPCKTEKKRNAKQKLLTYYQNNRLRMYYQTYKAKGLMIGSGPIESAHRTVIQKRLKQSGQRWTIEGAQKVVNLRVANMNRQWDSVVQLIRASSKSSVEV